MSKWRLLWSGATRKWGTTLAGVWLLVWALLPLLGITFPRQELVLQLLAIATGVLLLLDR